MPQEAMHPGGSWYSVPTIKWGRLHNSQLLTEETDLVLYNMRDNTHKVVSISPFILFMRFPFPFFFMHLPCDNIWSEVQEQNTKRGNKDHHPGQDITQRRCFPHTEHPTVAPVEPNTPEIPEQDDMVGQASGPFFETYSPETSPCFMVVGPVQRSQEWYL